MNQKNNSQFMILMYHRMINKKSNKFYSSHGNAGMVISVKKFIKQLRLLKREYSILRLDKIIDYIQRGIKLPHKSCAITFDDGLIDYYQNVFPVLKQLKIPATFFIIGDCIAGTGRVRWLDKYYYILDATPLRGQEIKIQNKLFNFCYKSDKKDRNKFNPHSLKNFIRNLSSRKKDKIINDLAKALRVTLDLDSLNKSLYLSRENILEMMGYSMDFGAHSMSHPDLGQLNFREAKREIIESGNIIRTITNKKDIAFAYPFGGPETYNTEIIKILRSNNFLCACTSIPGLNMKNTPLFELRRLVGEKFRN